MCEFIHLQGVHQLAVKWTIYNLPEPAAAESPEAISRPLLPSIFDDSHEEIVTNIEVPSPVGQESPITHSTIESDAPVYTPPTFENNIIEIPVIAEEPEIKYENNTSEISSATENISSETEAVIESTANTASESMAFMAGEGIFELDVKYKMKQGYSVQIGLYARYENVLAEVNKFKQRYSQKVYVHIDKKNGVPVYRLLLGLSLIHI